MNFSKIERVGGKIVFYLKKPDVLATLGSKQASEVDKISNPLIFESRIDVLGKIIKVLGIISI